MAYDCHCCHGHGRCGIAHSKDDEEAKIKNGQPDTSRKQGKNVNEL